MEVSGAFWVICITLVAVIILNAGIYMVFSKRKPDSFTSTFGNATREMRNPWKREDARMKELSQRIADLNKNAPSQGEAVEDQDHQDTHG